MIFFRQDYESFVNWEKGECSFKNEKFQRILEFAKTFPDEYVENIEISEVYDNWSDKKYFCERINIANEFCVSELNYKYGEENYYLSGVPSDKGGQHLASLFRNSYSISSNCKNIDLAYDFMDGIFEEDFQNECIKDGMSFPISRKILEDKLDAASEIEYETLEDGSQKPVVKYQIYYDYKTPGESIYQITEEEKMTVLQLIDSVSKSILADSNITQIFFEEVGSFFEDDKSVDEVLDIMESRVQIYMDEKY